MEITMLKSKIHRATISDAKLEYIGSITIDEDLLAAAGILEYEKVHVLNCNNGARLETYVIKGKAGSGTICLNGAAARCALPGDVVIILAYAQMTAEEAAAHQPKIVVVDGDNKIVSKI